MTTSLRNIVSTLVFIVTLLLIFDIEIRSIGHVETDPVAPILFLSIPAAKIAYFGLLLPIFYFILLEKNRSNYLKGGLLFFLLGSILYGTLISIIRGNTFIPFAAADLLVCLSLFTGLCLGALLPNTLKKIAAILTLTSISATIIATAILFTLPDADFLHSHIRTTHPSVFVLLGLPLVLTAPSMIISTLLRNRKLIAISWLSTGILIIVAVIITQTRSLALTFLLSIMLSILTLYILSSHYNQNSKKNKPQKMLWKVTVVFLVLIIAAFSLLKDNLEPFLLRMQSASAPTTDGGIAPRLEEVPRVLESMNLFEHVTGTGFGPALILTDWRGNPHNTMHMGILNVWWRLGFPIFFAVIFLFVKLFKKWISSLKLYSSRSLWHKVSNETLAVIICAPGVITLFFISCMSGGWAISAMIPLGILWGVYRKIAYGENIFPSNNDVMLFR